MTTTNNTLAQFEGSEISLPHAIEMEKSVLSSMLQLPEEYIFEAIEKKLEEKHFYSPAHKIIFNAILDLNAENRAIELVGFHQYFVDNNNIEKIGGISYLTEIYTYAATSAYFPTHLEVVKSKYILREIIKSSEKSIRDAYDSPEDAIQILDESEQGIFAIRQDQQQEETKTNRSQLREIFDDIHAVMNNSEHLPGLKTGYRELDIMSGGLKKGDLFVIAARPSMGKTALVMDIIEDVCLNQNKPAAVFSCEMPSKKILSRLLHTRAEFPSSQLKRGTTVIQSDLKKLKQACTDIDKAKLFIDDTSNINITELRAKARRWKKEHDIEVIAIDYLQLMKASTRQAQNSREREIAEISSGLKALAKELDIPIIVLAQLNRGPEARANGEPRMSDLRESGSIEQDADMIGLLYRPAYYAKDENERNELEGQALLNISKNRDGEVGEIKLNFDKEITKFKDMDYYPNNSC